MSVDAVLLMPLQDTVLPKKVIKVLMDSGMKTMGQLFECYSDLELPSIPKIGLKSISVIENSFEFYGLKKYAKSTKMAKVAKPKKRGKYDEKLAVKGSFMDIMKAAAKHADDNSPAKKKP